MCVFNTPKMPAAPELPPEAAAMKSPDRAAVRDAAGQRTTDRMRSGARTILTSGSGVTSMAETEKKTLLGA